MIEQELREGLARAVDTEPPLDFDPGELIARAERETRRRRALAGTGALTVLVVLVAVAVPAALGLVRGRPGSTPAAGPAPASTQLIPPVITLAPSESLVRPTPSREYDTAALRVAGQKFTAVLSRVLPAALAGAHDISIQSWRTGDVAGGIAPGPGSLNTYIRFVTQETPVAIRFQVDAPGAGLPADPSDQCDMDQVSGPDCYPSVSPKGGTLLVEKLYPNGVPAGRMISVTDFRPDGSKVSATAYNWDPTDLPRKFVPALPVTAAQLDILVTDQDIGFAG